MSVVTETEVVYGKEISSSSTAVSRKGMFSPTEEDESDFGLIMKMDNKLKDSTIMDQSITASTSTFPALKNPSAVRPSAVSSQLCGQGHEVTGWVLRGVLFLQTTHIPLIKFTHKLNEAFQQKARLLIPAFFYLSLLVLFAQVAVVVVLFSQSFMPIGMWFLLVCIGILAAMFCYSTSSSWKSRQRVNTPVVAVNTVVKVKAS